MSRATSIWIIFDAQEEFKAAFTVRHEMLDWLRKQKDVRDWLVLHAPDNPDSTLHHFKTTKRYDAEELL